MGPKLKLVLLAAATAVLGAVAISNQSFWIDEGSTALKAIQPTLRDWAAVLWSDGSSNLQLPLDFVYLWIWEKLIGGSEIALRAANLPPFFFGLVALVWGFKARPQRQFWLATLALTNAFTWYYVGEVRPYILVFAGSSLCLASLARAYYGTRGLSPSPYAFPMFCFGIVILSATSLIAVPWAGAMVLGCIIILGWAGFFREIRRHSLCSVATLAALSCLGGYYLWTISLGARASDIGRTGIANVFFVFYEQLGLAGLGPGRNEMRVRGAKAVIPFAIPLCLGALSLVAPLLASARCILQRKERRIILLTGVVVALPFAAVMIAGYAVHMRLLGRHLTPLFPFLLLGVSIGIEYLWRHAGRLGLLALAFYFALQLASACEIRFEARHVRDNYRDAAAIARQKASEGAEVWWVADGETATYYRVPLHSGKGGVILLLGPLPSQLAGLPEPQTIIVSKPETFDGKGAVDAFVKAHGFHEVRRLQSFQIFEK